MTNRHLSSALGLQVGLDQPQPLVDAARDFREEAGGIDVAEIVGLVDRSSGGLAERRQNRRERCCGLGIGTLYTRLIATSMLPRVALEYGHT